MSKRAAAVQLTSDNYEVEEQEYEEVTGKMSNGFFFVVGTI